MIFWLQINKIKISQFGKNFFEMEKFGFFEKKYIIVLLIFFIMIRTIISFFLIMVTITSCGTNNAANNENVSATQNTDNSAKQDFVYVDVRTDEEWAE